MQINDIYRQKRLKIKTASPKVQTKLASQRSKCLGLIDDQPHGAARQQSFYRKNPLRKSNGNRLKRRAFILPLALESGAAPTGFAVG